MHNQDIKNALKESGVRQWELAQKYGVSEFYFSRKLRKELPSEEKYNLFMLIAQIKDGREASV